jgi:hypothetical protein
LGLIYEGLAQLLPDLFAVPLDPQVRTQLTRLLLGYFLMMAVVINPFQMWKESQHKIATLNERLRPKLRVVCGEINPFFQWVDVPKRGRSTILRVGVCNQSDVVIEKARVVLQRFDLITQEGTLSEPEGNLVIPVEHAMRVMSDEWKNGRFDVPPGDHPSVYVDIAVQATPAGGPPATTIYLPYACRAEFGVPAEKGCLLTLRVEGGGTSRTKTLLLKGGREAVIRLIESDLDATKLEALAEAAAAADWVEAEVLCGQIRNLANGPLATPTSERPNSLDRLMAATLTSAVTERQTKDVLEIVQSLT